MDQQHNDLDASQSLHAEDILKEETVAEDQPSQPQQPPVSEPEADATSQQSESANGDVPPHGQPDSDAVAEAEAEGSNNIHAQQPNSELTKLKSQIIRLSADMENMRRRHQQEIARAHSYGLEKCFRELMPVLDGLGLALVNTETDKRGDDPLYEGVMLTHQMLVSALEKFGLSRVDPEPSNTFDPQIHEAITTAPTSDMPPKCVVQVIQCGYQLGDRLLRPARVVVSKEQE